jgi:hypothetical protein
MERLQRMKSFLIPLLKGRPPTYVIITSIMFHKFAAMNKLNTTAFVLKSVKRSAGFGKPLPSSAAMVRAGNHVDSP